MIKLYEINQWTASSKNEALIAASDYTGFNKDDFKCEVIREPKRVGLFKKEDGIYHCWYEYMGMNADKELKIVDAHLYFDTTQKKILVIRFGFKSYEIDYSDLIDYEMVIASSTQTHTISNKNKALKGAILFGTTGAVVGAADSETVTRTSEIAELIIRLRFANKESFEILTCNTKCNTQNKKWRDILDQGKIADEFFRELLEEQ
ncbi:hypothetical protein [Candidatus Merdisoma sp. JLR.KK006]|uniref:hypothetical protein n=1 Tax=Candidatus Merdisoma sp. JLR.KK006 TaxID=3112626 RepID=UPI002FF37785